MKIRKARSTDFDSILNLYQQRDLGPKFDKVVSTAVIEDEDKIIAFADFRLLLEATILIDKNIPHRKAVEVIKELIEVGKLEARKHGFDSIHAFTTVHGFDQILAKHFGFKYCKGSAQYLAL